MLNFDELRAKGKSLDYIEGYIDGQKDALIERKEMIDKFSKVFKK